MFSRLQMIVDKTIKIVLPLYEKIEECAAVFDKKSNLKIGIATVEWSIQMV